MGRIMDEQYSRPLAPVNDPNDGFPCPQGQNLGLHVHGLLPVALGLPQVDVVWLYSSGHTET